MNCKTIRVFKGILQKCLTLVCVLFLLAFAETILPAAVISYQVASVGINGAGQSQYRYNYSFSGLQLMMNQEIDLRFDPALYDSLSNGKTGPGFDLLLFQPNIPPMAVGDYSDLALINNPPLTGIFSVDFIYKGQGTPGSQPFFINQYAGNGSFQGVITSGVTVPFSISTVPEPATVCLCCTALLLGGLFWRRSVSSIK